MALTKKGDFNKILHDKDTKINRIVKFVDEQNDAPVSKIVIYGYSQDEKKCVEVEFKSKALLYKYISLLPSHLRDSNNVSISDEEFNIYIRPEATETKDISIFVRTIYQIDELDEITRIEISQCLNDKTLRNTGAKDIPPDGNFQQEVLLALKEIKKQNKRLLNKITDLEDEIKALKMRNHELVTRPNKHELKKGSCIETHDSEACHSRAKFFQ
jgi:hypothetical protein